jgi:hypothetical protein
MTRVEIERRLRLPLLAVHVAGMESTAVVREEKFEAAVENVLNAVEAILRENTHGVIASIDKLVTRR